jgi:hypothetical protein
MDDIRRLKAGKILMANGFKPASCKSFGRVVAIGVYKIIEVGSQILFISVDPMRYGKHVEYKIWFQGETIHEQFVSRRKIIPTINRILSAEGVPEIGGGDE